MSSPAGLKNQKSRYAIRLPKKLQEQLVPLVEKVDVDAARHLSTIHRQIGGDVEVPATGAHLVVIARIAAQHNDLPHAHSLFNAIANVIAR